MKDRVPLYPGRVKLVPVSGQANTYDMERADHPTQVGHPLNKNTLLKDATAALFGLGSDAVPDDALALLSRFHNNLGNEYVWSKTKIEDSEKYDIAVEEPFKHGTAAPWYYSDSFHVEGNQFVLDNPQSATPSASLDNAIKGKYFYSSPSGTEIRKMPEDAVITDGSPITVSYIFSYTNARIETGPVLYGYVNSPDPNAYPPAVSDGYTYTALGQLGSAARVEILTYTGADQTTKTITFSNTPKIVLIFTNRNNTTYYVPSVYVWGYPRIFKAKTGASGTSYSGLSETYYMVKATTSGNSLTLEYTTNPSYNLFNDSFETYTVVAIG